MYETVEGPTSISLAEAYSLLAHPYFRGLENTFRKRSVFSAYSTLINITSLTNSLKQQWVGVLESHLIYDNC